MQDASRDLVGEFGQRYSVVGHPALARAELRVIGGDYGATSYTTRAQVDYLVEILGLWSDQLVLDVGSGAGWPGVYVATSVGCRVILTDLLVEGMTVATDRGRSEDAGCASVCASGEALPFGPAVFDAVMSSDVLC